MIRALSMLVLATYLAMIPLCFWGSTCSTQTSHCHNVSATMSGMVEMNHSTPVSQHDEAIAHHIGLYQFATELIKGASIALPILLFCFFILISNSVSGAILHHVFARRRARVPIYSDLIAWLSLNETSPPLFS